MKYARIPQDLRDQLYVKTRDKDGLIVSQRFMRDFHYDRWSWDFITTRAEIFRELGVGATLDHDFLYHVL